MNNPVFMSCLEKNYSETNALQNVQGKTSGALNPQEACTSVTRVEEQNSELKLVFSQNHMLWQQ